jgi:hypothetical protein
MKILLIAKDVEELDSLRILNKKEINKLNNLKKEKENEGKRKI